MDSKKNCLKLSKNDLVKLAIRRLGMTYSASRHSTKEQICNLLHPTGRSPVQTPPERRTPPASPEKAGPSRVSRSRSISPRRLEVSPLPALGRVRKPELIELALPRLTLTPEGIRALNVDQLKELLYAFEKKRKVQVGDQKGKALLERRPPIEREELTHIRGDDGELPEIFLFDNQYASPRRLSDRVEGDCITRSRVPLRNQQIVLVNHLARYRGAIAVHGLGSGKTLIAVTASQCYLDRNPDHQVVFISPKSLKQNFRATMRLYGADPDDPRIRVFSYQGYVNAIKRGEVDCENSMLIVDEAHNLRNIPDVDTGIRVTRIIECAKKADRVLLLTATPLINEPDDVATLVSMIDGTNIDSKSYRKLTPEQFNKRFGNRFHFYSPDPKILEEFYPEKREHEVFIPMDPDYYQNYEYLESDIGTKTEKGAFYNSLRQGSNDLEEHMSPKVEWIVDHLEKNLDKGKYVIFSHYLTSGTHLLEEELIKKGIPYAVIDGSKTEAEREVAKQDYNQDKIRVLLITKAGGEGLDLKKTRYMIVMEPGWNEAEIRQVIGRGVRYKSHEDLPRDQRVVDVYRLFLVKPGEWVNLKSIGPDQVSDEYLRENELIEELDPFPSVDLYLRDMSLLKERANNAFLEKIKRIAIK